MCFDHIELHTLIALCSSVTCLTVTLASHRVTAAVSVSTVARFYTVCAPVACIARCNTNNTSDTNRREIQDQCCVRCFFRHCYLSYSCGQSSQAHRYIVHSLHHSEHCSRRYTSFGILGQNVRLDMLHKKTNKYKESINYKSMKVQQVPTTAMTET